MADDNSNPELSLDALNKAKEAIRGLQWEPPSAVSIGPPFVAKDAKLSVVEDDGTERQLAMVQDFDPPIISDAGTKVTEISVGGSIEFTVDWGQETLQKAREMNANKAIAALRGVLSEGPSLLTIAKLLTLALSFPEEHLDFVADYIHARLDKWKPEELVDLQKLRRIIAARIPEAPTVEQAFYAGKTLNIGGENWFVQRIAPEASRAEPPRFTAELERTGAPADDVTIPGERPTLAEVASTLRAIVVGSAFSLADVAEAITTFGRVAAATNTSVDAASRSFMEFNRQMETERSDDE